MAKKPKLKHVFCDSEKRQIYLRGEIRPATSCLIKQALTYLAKRGATEDAQFYISSEGGNFCESLKIYHMIVSVPFKITTVAVDYVASGALLILQAGHKRAAFAGATIAFHQTVETFIGDLDHNANDYLRAFLELQRIDAIQLLILTRKSEKIKEIFNLFNTEAEISAKEALKFGLIDKIIKPPKN